VGSDDYHPVGGKEPPQAGDLVIKRKTNKPCLILKVDKSSRLPYGDMKRRYLYKVLEDGRIAWIHDIALAAEYRRINVAD
tara:strand:+ start:183 stop:422 length:240 start_codon:yes stop_codon:yes gene_type:complete